MRILSNLFKGKSECILYSEVYFNGDIYIIKTITFCGLKIFDYEMEVYYLPETTADLELGGALLKSLSHSRKLTLDKFNDLFGALQENYKKWVDNLILSYGYKSKSKLFKHMMSCDIESHKGVITIIPTCHEKLEAWSGEGIKETDHVKIPDTSSPEEVGAALRLAFSRCRGLGS